MRIMRFHCVSAAWLCVYALCKHRYKILPIQVCQSIVCRECFWLFCVALRFPIIRRHSMRRSRQSPHFIRPRKRSFSRQYVGNWAPLTELLNCMNRHLLPKWKQKNRTRNNSQARASMCANPKTSGNNPERISSQPQVRNRIKCNRTNLLVFIAWTDDIRVECCAIAYATTHKASSANSSCTVYARLRCELIYFAIFISAILPQYTVLLLRLCDSISRAGVSTLLLLGCMESGQNNRYFPRNNMEYTCW